MDLEELAGGLGVGRGPRAQEAAVTGIVQQHVDATVAIEYARDGLGYGRWRRHVELHGFGVPAGLPSALRFNLQLCQRARGEDDLRSLRAERMGGREADPARCARDHDHFILQLHVRLSPLRSRRARAFDWLVRFVRMGLARRLRALRIQASSVSTHAMPWASESCHSSASRGERASEKMRSAEVRSVLRARIREALLIASEHVVERLLRQVRCEDELEQERVAQLQRFERLP